MATVTGKNVGSAGFGLMGMDSRKITYLNFIGLTWRPNPPPEGQAFEVMRKALSLGANLWNGGQLYGTAEYNSVHLLNKYFTKYPEDAEKVVLSIKSPMDAKNGKLSGDPVFVREQIEKLLEVMDGKKFVDIYEVSRVDPDFPIEETVSAIAEFVKAGKIGGVGLSECGAQTIRRAAKIHPIAAVEVEFSLFYTDILDNGVAAACAELGIPIVAYSPLSRGFLTGQIKSPDDIEEGDFRKHQPRFFPENFDTNMELVREIETLAQKKGCKSSQLAMAWVKAQSKRNGNPIIIPIPGTVTVERVVENLTDVTVTEDDLNAIDAILKKLPVAGGRYSGPLANLEFA